MKKLAMLVAFMVSWKVIGSQVTNYDLNKTPEENKGACEVLVREGAKQFKTLAEAKKAAEEVKATGQAIDIKISKVEEIKQ